MTLDLGKLTAEERAQLLRAAGAVARARMLVATQSFTADYDGQTVAIHRGRTRIDPEHELVQRYPHRFVERAHDTP